MPDSCLKGKSVIGHSWTLILRHDIQNRCPLVAEFLLIIRVQLERSCVLVTVMHMQFYCAVART
jgi:hypothetical protein